MISLGLLFAVCLVFSAFFSGIEMAFISCNQLRIRELAHQGNPTAKKVLELQRRPQEFLSVILIGNNIVNVATAVILTYILKRYWQIESEWLVTAILFPIIVIFGEMMPKDYCRLYSEKMLLRSAGVLSFFFWFFHLPVLWVTRLVDILLGRFKTVMHKNIFVSENEFRMLIEESAKSGVLEDHEQKLINTILDFERVRISSVMIPLEKAVKVDIYTNIKTVKDLARKTGAHMVLVYEEIPSIVVGMVYVFDLLFEEKEDQTLRKYLRSPVFLAENTSSEKAFLTLQQKRQSFAVVLDDRDETVGVVPIERLLEF